MVYTTLYDIWCAESESPTEANDTERPPPPEPTKYCYFCGEVAEAEVYWGMSACKDCKRRAADKRDRNR